jgi:hypothetical protein
MIRISCSTSEFEDSVNALEYLESIIFITSLAISSVVGIPKGLDPPAPINKVTGLFIFTIKLL